MTHQVFDDFLWKGGLYSKALIPRNQFLYSLSPLSVVMEHVIPQHCPLNVIYIRVLRGHCMRVNICYRFHTWFLFHSRIDSPPKPVQKFSIISSMKRNRIGAASSLANQGLLEPQSTYRSRGEIGRAYTTTLLVMVDRVKRGGAWTPHHPHQAGLILPS
jgi:hypothetical protein